jgi:transcriptional regulator with XRE-family HTH domain
VNIESDFQHLGQRLQELRRAQGLTLEQLAVDSGFSTGYLSQIENGGAVPSLAALQLIAAELGVEVATFFPEKRAPRTRLVRASERPAFRIEPHSGGEYALLAEQVYDRAFTAVYARHPLRGGSERPFRRLGEEFGLVLRGRLQITVDGDAHELGPGDWIHYSSHPSHSARVISDEPVEALWFLTPAVI